MLQTFYVDLKDWTTQKRPEKKNGFSDFQNETYFIIQDEIVQLSSTYNFTNPTTTTTTLATTSKTLSKEEIMLTSSSNHHWTQLEISQWRKITLSSGNYIFVYSAFFDDRLSTPVVRLNIVAPLRFNRKHDRTRHTHYISRPKMYRINDDIKLTSPFSISSMLKISQPFLKICLLMELLKNYHFRMYILKTLPS